MVGQYIKNSSLINNEFEAQYINLGTSKSIDEIGKNPLRKVMGYSGIIFKTVSQVVKNRPQLAYLSITAKGMGFYKDVVIAFLLKLFGVPLVLHYHNKGVSDNQHKFLANVLYKLLFKNIKVILLSPYLYYDIKKYVKEDAVFYCPNGIPTLQKEFNEKPTNDIVTILFLSNLIESKGVYILLDALKILANTNVRFQCDFVGEESAITEAIFDERVTALQLESHVNYLGKKYGEEKVVVFSKADIFVHPTFSDCFPLVLLEASQYKLPMVSTYEGAIPEVIDDGINGFLVPQNNSAALAEKLEVLIKDAALRKKMGEQARLKFKENYSLEKFEGRMVAILNKVLK